MNKCDDCKIYLGLNPCVIRPTLPGTEDLLICPFCSAQQGFPGGCIEHTRFSLSFSKCGLPTTTYECGTEMVINYNSMTFASVVYRSSECMINDRCMSSEDIV